MLKFDVRADVKDVQRNLQKLRRDIAEKATVSAINKTVAKARTEMVRAISQEYAIPSRDVRARMRIQRASRGKLTAILDPFASRRRGRSLNVIHFVEKKVTTAEARRRAKAGTLPQLHFQIKRAGGKKIIRGAFIGNKGRTVFIRTGKERLPIKAVSTIDVPQMFNTTKIRERVAARVRAEFKVEMERAIRFHLAKMGR